MDNETIQVTYEAIHNPVLRLLIWFGVAVATSLAAAVVYLYRERQALQREMLEMNKEAIRVYEGVENALESITKEITYLRETLHRNT